jgi:hypothetical protein
MKLWGLGLAVLLLAADSAQAQPRAAAPTPAVASLLDAFKSRPVVAIGDHHGLAQELDLYTALIRHPRFADEVGNVVVEFGGARHQSIIDRYTRGDHVPYTELRKVWTDTVGWIPTPGYIGFMNVFAQVRATNASLPPERKIRVWLGEPPIDWSTIRTRDDLTPYQLQRDTHPSSIIRREILARGRKALVIYGGAHLVREQSTYIPGAAADPRAPAAIRAFFQSLADGAPDYDSMAPRWRETVRRLLPQLQLQTKGFGPLESMEFRGKALSGDIFVIKFANANVRIGFRYAPDGKIDGAGFEQLADDGDRGITDQVEDEFPNSVFVVAPYVGYSDKACTRGFEQPRAHWTAPGLIQPVRDTQLAADLLANGCRGLEQRAIADALLYLGPAAELVYSPENPELYLDEDYRREASRRVEIFTGKPLAPAADMRNFPSTPERVWPSGPE